jgi:apolipoprotein N-acyltransferase
MASLARAAFCLVCGLAHAASMGTPWNAQPAGWLQLLALAALVWQLGRCESPKQAAWMGWLFSTAWLCGTFWWLFISMHTYGGLNAVLTVISIVALAGLLALYYAIACAAYVRLSSSNKFLSALLFAALWMMAEICRGTWLTGFGWGAAGYAHIDGLAALAKYVGAYGVAALAAWAAWWLVALGRGVGRRMARIVENRAERKVVDPALLLAALPLLLLAVVTVVTQRDFSTPAGTLEVALLQGNIAQDEKFQPGTGVADSLRWYGEQVANSQAALIVAPETAIPLLPKQLPEGYWEALTQPFVRSDVVSGAKEPRALLVGIPLGSFADGYTNSVIGLQTGGSAYQYDKHHLVPFGEFIPPLFKWFTQMMNIPLGDFNRGAVGQPSFEVQGQRLAPNICYEDLFGEELGARFADPAKSPTIFVNVSNIGWFGNSIAIDQHLNISRMRAIEFERPFIRATNTGATVIIDHTGRVTHSLLRHTRGVLTGQVQGRAGDASNGYGLTPFAQWVSRFGLWPYWLLGIGIVLIAAWGKRVRNTRLL